MYSFKKANAEENEQRQKREEYIASQYDSKVFACDAFNFVTHNFLFRIVNFKVSILAR
jgi:hypothetical protein